MNNLIRKVKLSYLIWGILIFQTFWSFYFNFSKLKTISIEEIWIIPLNIASIFAQGFMLFPFLSLFFLPLLIIANSVNKIKNSEINDKKTALKGLFRIGLIIFSLILLSFIIYVAIYGIF